MNKIDALAVCLGQFSEMVIPHHVLTATRIGSIETSRAPSGQETQALVDYLVKSGTKRFVSEKFARLLSYGHSHPQRCEHSVEVIKKRMVGFSPPQLPLLLDLLDALVNEVGDDFHRALISQQLPIRLLRVGSHLGPRGLQNNVRTDSWA